MRNKQQDNLTKQFSSLSIKEKTNQQAINTINQQLIKDVKKIIKLLRNNHDQKTQYFTINYPQKSQQWHQQRKIRLTASNFKRYIHARQQTRLKMSHQILHTQKQFFTSPAIQYGNQNQAQARKQYQKIYPDFIIKQTTLTISTAQPWLGGSPDGLVYDKSNNLIGGIQIKCPFSKRNMKVEQAIASKLFYLYIEDGCIKLDKKNDYYYQIQGQMMVLNLKWIDLVVRTDINFKIVKIQRDNLFIEHMRKELRLFYFENYIWEVLKRFVRPKYLKQDVIYFMSKQKVQQLMKMVL